MQNRHETPGISGTQRIKDEFEILMTESYLDFDHFEFILRMFNNYDKNTFDAGILLIAECFNTYYKKQTTDQQRKRFVHNIKESIQKMIKNASKLTAIMDAIKAEEPTTIPKRKRRKEIPEPKETEQLPENPESFQKTLEEFIQIVRNSNMPRIWQPKKSGDKKTKEAQNRRKEAQIKHEYLKRFFEECAKKHQLYTDDSADPKKIADYMKRIKTCLRFSDPFVDTFLEVLDAVKLNEDRYILYSVLVSNDNTTLQIINHEIKNMSGVKYARTAMDSSYAELIESSSEIIITDKRFSSKQIGLIEKRLRPHDETFATLAEPSTPEEKFNKYIEILEKKSNAKNEPLKKTLESLPGCHGKTDKIASYMLIVNNYISGNFIKCSTVLNTLEQNTDYLRVLILLGADKPSLKKMMRSIFKRGGDSTFDYHKISFLPDFIKMIHLHSMEIQSKLTETDKETFKSIQTANPALTASEDPIIEESELQTPMDSENKPTTPSEIAQKAPEKRTYSVYSVTFFDRNESETDPEMPPRKKRNIEKCIIEDPAETAISSENNRTEANGILPKNYQTDTPMEFDISQYKEHINDIPVSLSLPEGNRNYFYSPFDMYENPFDIPTDETKRMMDDCGWS